MLRILPLRICPCRNWRETPGENFREPNSFRFQECFVPELADGSTAAFLTLHQIPENVSAVISCHTLKGSRAAPRLQVFPAMWKREA